MVDRFRLFARPIFGLCILLLLGAVLAAVILAQMHRLQQTRQWVWHTYTVISQVDHIFERVSEVDAAHRGYIMSHTDEYLQRYQAALQDKDGNGLLEAELLKLEKLTEDNQRQNTAIKDLHGKIDQKIQQMQDNLRLAHEKSVETAQLQLRNGEGRRLMEKILASIKDIKKLEQELLTQRTQISEEANQLNTLLSAIFVLLLLGIVSFSFVAIQKEMARRQSVETDLRESSTFQRAILDSASSCIIACDPQGVIVMFNKAAERMLGYTADEMIGHHTPAVIHLHDEMVKQAAKLSDELGRVVTSDNDVFVAKVKLFGIDENEWTYVRKNGTTFPVHLSVTALRNHKNEITGFMGIAQDISERKEIEKMKNEFISTVSHELRTPLTSIRGSLGLIMGHITGKVSDDTYNLVNIAYKNTERLTRLINDILDIEKIESGNMAFDRRPLQVDTVLQQAIEENQSFADKYSVNLVLNPAANKAMVMGDLDRLLQVMTNLLSNAVKYAPRGSNVVIASSRVGSQIRISVTDKGSGIPEDFKERIFTKFAQADSSDTRQKGGTGLGLSISKSIVEALDGEIGFDSHPGETVFHVTLPELANAHFHHEPVQAPVGGKILICEDDPHIAELLNIMLSGEGYQCTVAHTVSEARTFLNFERYDAMTLDLSLPDQDGISFIRQLRADIKTLHLPVVVISAHAEQGRKKLNGDAVGIIDWLPKPIDFDRLKRALQGINTSHVLPALLHVEDDYDVSQVIALALREVAHVTFASSLSSARTILSHSAFDLVLLDILLPDGSGLDLLPVLSAKNIPVVILSVNQTPREIQAQVADSLVKSLVPEEKIVQTIKSFLQRSAAS